MNQKSRFCPQKEENGANRPEPTGSAFWKGPEWAGKKKKRFCSLQRWAVWALSQGVKKRENENPQSREKGVHADKKEKGLNQPTERRFDRKVSV